MKRLCLLLIICFSTSLMGQSTGKSKVLKIKYTLPAGWNVQEFGNPSTKTWEEPPGGIDVCKCSGILFYRTHKEGKMNVVLYPSTLSGLDSTKRNAVGNLQFEDVERYDKIRNNDISFERKKSNFIDIKTKSKSFEVYRYFAKVDNHFFIIYAWQENMQLLSAANQKLLFEMVNSIEAY